MNVFRNRINGLRIFRPGPVSVKWGGICYMMRFESTGEEIIIAVRPFRFPRGWSVE